jgi:predicted aspartyl protease
MSIPVNAQHGLIVIQAAVDGPSGSAVLRLALDTGATSTVINIGMLVALGYDPALVPERIQVTTGSGVEFVPRVAVHKIVALGQERTRFPVLGHT